MKCATTAALSQDQSANRLSAAAAAGERWVDQYLVPRVAEQMRGRSLDQLRVLQLLPDDLHEATWCRARGAHVSLASFEASAFPAAGFATFKLHPTGHVTAPDGNFDVIVTGHLERLMRQVESVSAMLGDCARVCAVGGGMLAPLATSCPFSLDIDRPLLSLREKPPLANVPALAAAFGEVRFLPVCGHFGWRSGGVAHRALGSLLDAYWASLARPEYRGIYSSKLNPLMMIWAAKSATDAVPNSVARNYPL